MKKIIDKLVEVELDETELLEIRINGGGVGGVQLVRVELKLVLEGSVSGGLR